MILAWGAPERCESRVLLAALGALTPPPPPGAGGPFALSAPGKLEELASRAGLIPKRADEVLAPFVFPDIDTAVRGALSSGPARKVIDHAGAKAAADAARAALAGSRQADGSYRQENAFRYVVATA